MVGGLSQMRRRAAWVALALVAAICTISVHARTDPAPADSLALALTELPVEGQQTYRLILQGGPFPYEKDGVVFGNRERLLPRQARGFYREYTVKTPGVRDRGARRMVCGGEVPTRPQACYYSADHYASFRVIVLPKH